MMKMISATNRMRSTALALCTFAIAATPSWAQAPQYAPPAPPQTEGAPPSAHPRMEHMQEHRLDMMTKHLSLTPDQVAQVKSINQDGMTQMMALRQDTSTPQADKHEKMKAIHDGQTAKIRAILTDDQKPKFDKMVAYEQERMEHHGGRDGEHGQTAPPPPPAA